MQQDAEHNHYVPPMEGQERTGLNDMGPLALAGKTKIILPILHNNHWSGFTVQLFKSGQSHAALLWMDTHSRSTGEKKEPPGPYTSNK